LSVEFQFDEVFNARHESVENHLDEAGVGQRFRVTPRRPWRDRLVGDVKGGQIQGFPPESAVRALLAG
jgi:hypothetical protein